MLFLSIDWNPNIELFKIGSFAIRYYSLMFVIAFVLGLQIMKKIYQREGLSIEKLDSLFIYTVIATLLGARIGHFLFYDTEFLLTNPLEVLLPVRFNPFQFTGYQVLWILDRVVIPVAAGAVFVRIGNLVNSEIIGKATNSDYGFVFVQLGEDFPRHPTQLYEAFGYVITFAVLYYFYWKTDKREKLGFLFGTFMVFLWSVRFIVEFFKEAQVDNRGSWDLNTGQLLSIPMILVGLYYMFRKTPK